MPDHVIRNGIAITEGNADQSMDSLSSTRKVVDMFPAAYDQQQDTCKNETVFYTLRSSKGTHFTGALTNGNSENEDITGLSSNKIRIKRVRAICVLGAARAFDFAVFNQSTFQTADMDTDTWGGKIASFAAADGQQINSGTYTQYYYSNGVTSTIDVPYEDLDGTYKLHVALVWRDANAKVAATTEYVVLIVDYEPAG